MRRLRAKLGSEYESMIGTVRQVGYKFVVPPRARCPKRSPVRLTCADLAHALPGLAARNFRAALGVCPGFGA